jgi:hypothetical protein
LADKIDTKAADALIEKFTAMLQENNYFVKNYAHLGYKDNLPALMNMLQTARKVKKEIEDERNSKEST